MCAGYANAVSGCRKLFNRLMFVIRDWDADDHIGKRPKEEFLQLVSFDRNWGAKWLENISGI